jgi:hypothetical protein
MSVSLNGELAERLKVVDKLLAERNVDIAGAVLGTLKERYPDNEEVITRLATLSELRKNGNSAIPIPQVPQENFPTNFAPKPRLSPLTSFGIYVVILAVLGGGLFLVKTQLASALATSVQPITEFNDDMNAAQKKEIETYKKAAESQTEIQKRTDEDAEIWQK